MKVFRAWDRGRNKVAFAFRDPETGRSKIGEAKFQWFFYVTLEDFNKHKSFFYNLREEKQITSFEQEKKYVKIFVDREHNNDLLDKNNEWVWEYKNFEFNKLMQKLEMNEIQTYEADLPLYKRWLLSGEGEIDDHYKVLFTDIETDDRDMKGQPIPGEKRILSIAFAEEETDKEACLCIDEDTDEAEKDLLTKAAKIFNSYDVLVAFNGKNFDFPYIMARMMRYGIQFDWRKLQLQDHLFIFKKHGPQLASYSLDNISKTILTEGKVEHEGMSIYQMWQKDRKLFKEYNLQDARLMKKIEKKTGFLAVARQINTIGMCNVDDIYVTRKIDMLLLKQAQEDGDYHFKTKVKQDEEAEEKTFEGAYVFDPITGLHRNIKVLDFASLYPNTIKTFNISPDTLITPENEQEVDPRDIITTPCGHRFRTDFVGLIPKVISRMAEQRNHYKGLMKTVQPNTVEHKTFDKLQYVFKAFGLSFYGAVGESHTRFYDVRVAESVTLGGQFLIKTIAKYIEHCKLQVIYGDTDSLFVSGIKDDKIIEVLLRNIQKICDNETKNKFNCKSSSLEMDYDKGFSTLIVVIKKRYAGFINYIDGRYLESPKLYIAGLEYKRTDNCLLVKRKQEEMLRMLLAENTAKIEDIRKFISDLKQHIFSSKATIEEIAFAQKLTKTIEDYGGKRLMHTMVAKEMQEDGNEVWVGDKISYFIERMDAEGKPVPVPSKKFAGKYDEMYYWNKKIFPPLQRILEVVFKNIDWETQKVKASGNRNTKFGRMSLWES